MNFYKSFLGFWLELYWIYTSIWSDQSYKRLRPLNHELGLLFLLFKISLISFFKNKFIYFILFIFGCFGSSLLCVGFSLFAASGGYSSLRCMGLSLRWLLLLRSMGSRRAGFSSCGSRALERRLSSCGAWA